MTKRLYFNELSWKPGSTLSRAQLDEFIAMWKALVADAGVKNIWAVAEIKVRFASCLSDADPVLKRKLLPIVCQSFHKLYPVEDESEVPAAAISRYKALEGRFETEDLDGFSCQITEPESPAKFRNIGAADGKPTSRVEMYLTEQNVLHLRPKEQKA